MHAVRASIRSKMADVKLGVMPSEGLIWPLAATRELDRNLNCGELHSRQSDSRYWNSDLSSQTTSDTDWLLHVQAQPDRSWLNALINLILCNVSAISYSVQHAQNIPEP